MIAAPRLLFLAAALGVAGAAVAQQPPPADPLLDLALPPLELGPPLDLPPVAPPDPALLEPLAPLAAFDATPSAEFQFTTVAEEGFRYRTRVLGLEPTGLEPQFRRMSALIRNERNPATAAQIASRASSDSQLMERLLFSEGWYDASIDSEIDAAAVSGETREADQRIIVSLTAEPGQRYRWREIAIDLIPPERPELAEGFGLTVGQPVRAIEVEEAEGALKLKLNRAGYPFVEIGARDVVLDADAPTATYLLTGDLGPQGRFGAIRMVGFQPFDEAHAAVIARFRPGQLYDAMLVDDLRRALIDTQLFGGVAVTPVDTGLREADGTAVTDIRISGNEGPLRRLAGQAGFSSGEGFRLEAFWQHRNLWRPEGDFTARLVLGTQEQRVGATMAKSNFRQRDRTLTLGAEVANERRLAYRASSVTLGAYLARNSTPIWQKPWTWSFGVELQASNEEERASREADSDRGRTQFLIAALPVEIGRDTSDDLLDPQRGYRVRLRLSPEVSRQAGLTDSYLRAIADVSAYRRVRDGLVMAGRARLGSIVGSELDAIAPTRRLYVGGGGSVRGFDYQGIGPFGVNDRPTGGRGLAEASLEGRYRFGDFGAVGFVDAGTLSQDRFPTFSDIRVGVGAGVRYFTAFGPLRLDVARAVNPGPRDPRIAIYVSIGQAF